MMVMYGMRRQHSIDDFHLKFLMLFSDANSIALCGVVGLQNRNCSLVSVNDMY